MTTSQNLDKLLNITFNLTNTSISNYTNQLNSYYEDVIYKIQKKQQQKQQQQQQLDPTDIYIQQISMALQILMFIYILLGLTFLINYFLMRIFFIDLKYRIYLNFTHLKTVFAKIQQQFINFNFLFSTACLDRLSKKYKFRESISGMFVAIGITIPELTTNIISCIHPTKQMIGYGFGTIIGSGVFDFTICFGFAAIFSFYFHQKNIKFHLKALLRDIYIYCFTLVFLILILLDYKVTCIESLILFLLWPLTTAYTFIEKSPQENEQISINGDPEHNYYDIISFNQTYNLYKNNPYDVHNDEYRLAEESSISSSDEELDNMIDKQNDQKQTKSKEGKNICIQYFKGILFPFKQIFRKTIPYESKPELAFAIIMIYIFLFVQLSIYFVGCFISQVHVSHMFIGLTLSSWGQNISDVISTSVAAKNKKMEFATSSIIGSQILNLQLALGLPWFLTTLINGQPIDFTDPSVFLSITVVLAVVIVCLILILLSNLNLHYYLGIEMIFIYFAYFIFEYFNSLFTPYIVQNE